MSPILSSYLEKIQYSIFDTAEIQPGPFRKLLMFNKPLSSERHPDDTNLIIGNILPAPQKAIIYRLRLESVHVSPEDRDNLRDRCTVEFSVGFKHYYRQPISSLFCDEEMRVAVLDYSGDEDSTKVLKEVAGKGMEFVVDTSEVTIESQQFFEVRIEAHKELTVLHPLKFRIHLDGYLYRPVC